MNTYFGVLEGSASNWGVWFPDRPGCVGAGESPEQAIESARTALALFDEMDRKEGLMPPPARSDEQLLQDPDVRDAVANGDRLLPIEADRLAKDTKVRA